MHLTRIRENHTFLTFVNCSILLPGRTKRGMYCWLQKTWPDSVRSAALIPMRQTRNSASTSTTECSRVQSKQRPTFHLLSSLSMSYSTSTLLVIFGGRLKDIEMILSRSSSRVSNKRTGQGWGSEDCESRPEPDRIKGCTIHVLYTFCLFTDS